MATAPRARICDLPTEILVSIFSFLPVADLAHCSAVCDQWHEIVKRFTCLWKGKAYKSTRSPTECAETRAVLRVLHFLPPFQQVFIESADRFYLRISYPLLVLSVKYIAIIEDSTRLSCECLSARLDIAADILSHRSTIHFDILKHLRILAITSLDVVAPHDSADCVVRASLGLFPSLRQLSVCVESLSADYLDTVEGFNRLQALEISCSGLQKLSFLRHCSGGLEELHLVGCHALPSRELAELPRLDNLRKLKLSHCQFEEGDLAAAVQGLGNLESLRLNCCSPIRDLSALQHCRRLRELCITKSPLLGTFTPDGQWLHKLPLSVTAGRHSLHVKGTVLTADSLSAVLSTMEEQGLCTMCVAYLGALRNCSQLRHVCCKFAHIYNMPELFHEGVHITITSSAQV